MQSSSDRRNKRDIREKGIGKEIDIFKSARTPESPVAYSSCCGVNASFEGKPQESVEQKGPYVPDPEILEVAFGYEPELSSQDLSGMNLFENLRENLKLTGGAFVRNKQRLLEKHLGVGVINPKKNLDETPFDSDDSDKIRDW